MGSEVRKADAFDPLLVSQSKFKKSKLALSATSPFSALPVSREIRNLLPTLQSIDYFTKPCVTDLAALELLSPGYCSRVQDFTVGRYGYGCIKFTGETDVRWLDLDQIVKFGRHEVVVYEDEYAKPVVGQGLNKTAEVTLVLQITPSKVSKGKTLHEKLRSSAERQGANFISFNAKNGEWVFSVHHFSRFGLDGNEEEDICMDDATQEVQVQGPSGSDIDEESALIDPALFPHSLPFHLGLDPVKMKEMRMLMFPTEEEDDVETTRLPSKESAKPYLQHSSHRRSSPSVIRKTPLALLEYNTGSFASSPRSILLAQQNKGLSVKTTKVDGFKLDIKDETPVEGSHSRNLVDAGLFMGMSFRVGWGPNGVLVHTGAPVGSTDSARTLSSLINLEKVAVDRVARDENNKVREELVDFSFTSPLNFHKEINHQSEDVVVGPFKLKLQKLVCNRLELSDICRSYIDIIEERLKVPGLTTSSRVVLMHQVFVWELIKVLFSLKEMINDKKEGLLDDDSEAVPLMRRAEFSYWLQESVCHRVQSDISSLTESNDLEHLLLLLSGRQLDAAVELAVSKGDVRLACLVSQAGGPTVDRTSMARQLDIWRLNGLDFNFIEEDRLRLFELLAGNIHDAVCDLKLDWKRFLGLLMWYHLAPNTPLPAVFHSYQNLLDNGKAPFPVPIYIDEGLTEEKQNHHCERRFDVSYYLMLLHASEGIKFKALKSMFSAFASTNDPLDHHMIWHQRSVLEAIGIFSSNDLHGLDMGLISQLLCLGQCHWAIYVALHMPCRNDYPFLQVNLIRELLFQYCEAWSAQESQRQFIEDLGIPRTWLHEALATYFAYYGDFSKALEHYLVCEHWQKAHSIFMTSVAHFLFSSDKHSEIWRLATSMEDHSLEVEDWDLGAGVFISFYQLKSSLQEANDTMVELETLEDRNDACREFLGRLNKSLAVWGGRITVDASSCYRAVFATMAEVISSLLVASFGEDSTVETQLSCFDTVFTSPVPEDLASCHLQNAVSVFTRYLSETTA